MNRPEILAPAGDLESLRAALAAGADAVYFGLDDGFNARAKADNFSRANLPQVVAEIHRAGARAYVTLNTLVFQPELPAVEAILRDVAAAGVDAIIVQDPAVALIAGAVCPDLELHASTQMTVSSPEGGRFAEQLGIERVVAPRELSVDELRAFAAGSDLELEVFVHGALCMSWSGQCLTSEAWGGRSANRGQCAQSCRLPYGLVVDGQTRDLGEVRYLLSPKDLAGFDAVPALAEIGISSLKIEGRYKGPAYVVTAVEGYSRWLDAVQRGVDRDARRQLAKDRLAMSLAYSRGFGAGFLGGADHQVLVDGRFPKHRGVQLGEVAAVEGDRVRVSLASGGEDAAIEVRAGMGVVFDAGRPQDDEPGGPIFSVAPAGPGALWLGFGRPGPDLSRVSPGERVWVTGDPALARAARQRLARAPEGRVPVAMWAEGAAGEPLRVRAVASRLGADPVEATAESAVPLAPARGRGIDAALLRDKLGALGGTPFRLDALEARALATGLHLPVSKLKAIRRALVAALQPGVERGPARAIAAGPVLPGLLARGAPTAPAFAGPAQLVALCREPEQLEAAIDAGVVEVELDWMDMVGLAKAVRRAKAAGLRATVATVRVQKPGEEGYDRRVEKLTPDGVLVRHWGAMVHFLERGAGSSGAQPVLHGDFSLNVTNSLTAAWLLERGLATVTASHDLDARQLMALLDQLPAHRVAVTIHHHIPTFHTEHCVYAHTLSDGADWRTCGRPCDHKEISLRDPKGREHPVVPDVSCRNTVFNAQAQSASALAGRLVARGVRRLRVEFVRETRAQAASVLGAWRALLDGAIDPPELRRRIGAHEQFGVTAGTMQVLR